MSKVELDTITSGYNLSKINENFQRIEGELNNKVLYREVAAGEPNHMDVAIDMNGNDIINLNELDVEKLFIDGKQVFPEELASDVALDELNQFKDDLAGASGSSLVEFKQPHFGSVQRTVQSKLRETVSVYDFGAIGDGVADDTFAVQTALNSGAKTVLFPTTGNFKVSTVFVTSRGQTLTGGGTITGQVTVAMPLGADIFVSIIAETTITGLTFAGTGINSINLRRGRGILINNNNFKEVGNCVTIQPIEADFDNGNHCVEDVNITNNTATLVGRLLYVDTSIVITGGRDWWLGNGDVHVSNNICRVSKIAFIQADRMDGLVCCGNTMLNYGAASLDMTKTYGVYIGQQCAQVIIKGNNIFETGKEGILLSNCADFIIEGNNIVQCGQSQVSSAIYVLSASPAVSRFGIITNNIINGITGHPITVSNVANTHVCDNVVYIGDRSYYYGVPSLPLLATLNLVNIEGVSGQFITIGKNNSPELLSKGVTPGAVGLSSPAHYRYDVTTTTTILDGTADRIHLNPSSAATIGVVSGGYDGQEIVLITFNANTTIGDAGTISGGNIFTSTGSNVPLPANRIFKLFRAGSSWYLK